MQLQKVIRDLAMLEIGKSKHALPGQPWDLQLLRENGLYRRSRTLFLKQGGEYVAELLSGPRSLGSAALLENRVTYSPIAAELIWAASDPVQKKDNRYLAELLRYSTRVFHEQNHRILWK